MGYCLGVQTTRDGHRYLGGLGDLLELLEWLLAGHLGVDAYMDAKVIHAHAYGFLGPLHLVFDLHKVENYLGSVTSGGLDGLLDGAVLGYTHNDDNVSPGF